MTTTAATPRRNTYAGTCTSCRQEVAAGLGHISKLDGAWTVRHVDCDAADPTTSQTRIAVLGKAQRLYIVVTSQAMATADNLIGQTVVHTDLTGTYTVTVAKVSTEQNGVNGAFRVLQGEMSHAPAAPVKTRRRSARTRSCVTGGNCSSFGSGRSCGADDCDGH